MNLKQPEKITTRKINDDIGEDGDDLCNKQEILSECFIKTDYSGSIAQIEYARSYASAAVELNSAVFWIITQYKVIWNRRFGTNGLIFKGQALP